MFEALAIEMLLAPRSVQAAALILSIDWSTAQNIMERAVDRGLQRRSLDDVKHVGIDEKNFGKGHDYVSVMADIDGSRVLEVSPERTIEACDSLWNTLSEKQKGNIKAVAMDMWQAFETSTRKNVPNASIVYDRFHISTYLGEAVDKVRRAEHKALMKVGDECLKGARYSLLFNPENLTQEKDDQLNAIVKSTLKTGRAWQLTELFRYFWEETDAVGGRAFFDRWYSWAIRSRLEPVKKVADAQGPAGTHPHLVRFTNQQQHVRRIQESDSGDQVRRTLLSDLRTLPNQNPILLRKTRPETQGNLATNFSEEPLFQGFPFPICYLVRPAWKPGDFVQARADA